MLRYFALFCSFSIISCATSKSAVFALRLRPDQDLKKSLDEFASQNDIRAGSIVSGVGSLKQASLRFANQPKETVVLGPVEIVSMTGTVSKFGSHLHLAVSDERGRTVGGHLKDGATVFTTVEITILEALNYEFQREPDKATGYSELSVKPRSK